jgi:LysM repeat protein
VPPVGGWHAHVEAFRELRRAAAQRTYVVQRGDSLVAIARRFGVTLAELVAANGIADPDRIFVNQLLRIPPAVFEPVPADEPETPTIAAGDSGRVEDGETLASLAADRGVTVEALAAANPSWQVVAGQVVTPP